VERRYLLEHSSWKKYRYVMLSQLSFEQWDALKGFFEAVAINDGYFDANTQQIWINLHRHYLKVLEKAGGVLDGVTTQELRAFTEAYISNTYETVGYEPQKSVKMATTALDAIDENILVSGVGERLIQLAT
jgi:hypothetical protein